MTRLSAADEYLLEQIRGGDTDAWRQLVTRYHGRLLAFATRELPSTADAEDAVQETFVSLLQGIQRYRSDSSLETYLFVILRRRIADVYRRRENTRTNRHEPLSSDDLLARDMTASWYVRRDETHEQQSQDLSQALETLVADLRTELKFDELLLVDLLFGAQKRNKEIAAHLEVDEKWIALRKHRFTKRLASEVTKRLDASDEDTNVDTTLEEIWSNLRPTCPKRSTLGKYLLGTLDDVWTNYIQQHVDVAECPFCAANLADLQIEKADAGSTPNSSRIMHSTIGFFRGKPDHDGTATSD